MIASAMTTVYVFWGAVLACCACLDAMFCGLETGIYRINKIRLALRAEAGESAAATLQRLGQNFNNVLSVLLIGTNLCRYVATFSISVMFVAAGAGHNAQWYTMAVAVPLMFVLQDSIPKGVLQRTAETAVYRLTWLLRSASVVFNVCGLAPLVRGFAAGMLRLLGRKAGTGHLLGHTGVEAAVAEGRASGMLTDYQSAMADRAMRVGQLCLRDVMVPMADVVGASTDAARDEVLALIRRHDYSRLPLRDADGQVAGVLDTYDILADDRAVPRDSMRPPLVLQDSLSVTDGFVAFQRANAMMAIVADEAGRHVGIVAVEDVVAQIVGQ